MRSILPVPVFVCNPREKKALSCVTSTFIASKCTLAILDLIFEPHLLIRDFCSNLSAKHLTVSTVGASPEPRSVGKKSKNERAPRALTTPESGVATGTASDVYSAGSESEWLPAPSQRRSAKMRRSGGAPHVR